MFMKAWIKNMEFVPTPKLTLQLDADDVKYQIAKTRCCNSLDKLVKMLKLTRDNADFGIGLENDIEKTQQQVIRSLKTRKALYDLRQGDGTYQVTIKSTLDDLKKIGRAHYYGGIAPACEFEFEFTDNEEWEADLIDAYRQLMINKKELYFLFFMISIRKIFLMGFS